MPGTFACVCHNEYKQWSGHGCELKDFCDADGGIENPCDRLNGHCVNTLDGPECLCKAGFRLGSDGTTCEGKEHRNKQQLSLVIQMLTNA